MSNSTEISLSSAEYCDSYDNELSGIEAEILIWPGYSVYLGPTENAPFIISATAPIKLPCIMQKSNVKITTRKGSFDSEIRIFIQNTDHNRGVVAALRKCRFLAGIKEAGKKVLQVFGVKKWETNQTLAKVNDDSVVIEFGTEFDSDKYIELVLSAVLNLPTKVNNFQFGDFTGAADAFNLVYNNDSATPFNGKVDEIFIQTSRITLNTFLVSSEDEFESPTTTFTEPTLIISIILDRLFPDGNGIGTKRIPTQFIIPMGGAAMGSAFLLAYDKPGWHVAEFVFRKIENGNPVGEEYRLVHLVEFVMP
jgi:hypothetical protein